MLHKYARSKVTSEENVGRLALNAELTLFHVLNIACVYANKKGEKILSVHPICVPAFR